jgi:hypothetical protein
LLRPEREGALRVSLGCAHAYLPGWVNVAADFGRHHGDGARAALARIRPYLGNPEGTR